MRICRLLRALTTPGGSALVTTPGPDRSCPCLPARHFYADPITFGRHCLRFLRQEAGVGFRLEGLRETGGQLLIFGILGSKSVGHVPRVTSDKPWNSFDKQLGTGLCFQETARFLLWHLPVGFCLLR